MSPAALSAHRALRARPSGTRAKANGGAFERGAPAKVRRRRHATPTAAAALVRRPPLASRSTSRRALAEEGFGDDEDEDDDLNLDDLDLDSDSEGEEEEAAPLPPPRPKEATTTRARAEAAAAPPPRPRSSSEEEEEEADGEQEDEEARAATTALAGGRLLRWLSRAASAAAGEDESDEELPVAVVDLPESRGGGRGLFATRDVAAGEALITVPLSLALVESDVGASPSSDDESKFLSRAPWPVRMGLELLERRAEARRRASEREGNGGGGEDDGDESDLSISGESSWFDLLPPSIPLPTTTFTASELRAAALSPAAFDFCRSFGRGVRASAEGPLRRRLETAGARPSDPSPALVWACSAVQSRTFVLSLPGSSPTSKAKVRRVLPPGIDFANHDGLSPSAEARVRHSPGAVQGREAVEEVVAPGGDGGYDAGESVIELVAGARGIRAGQEVTISYGNHPVDALFSLYGFVPRDAGGESSTVLFDSLSDVVDAAESVAARFSVSLPTGETRELRVSRLRRALAPLAAALSATSSSRASDSEEKKREGVAAAGRAMRGRLAREKASTASAAGGRDESESEGAASEAEQEAFWQGLLLTESGCDQRANVACRAAAKLLLQPRFAESGGLAPPNGGDVIAARVASLLSSLDEAPPAPDTPAGREAEALCAARGRILRSAALALGVPIVPREEEGEGEGGGRGESKATKKTRRKAETAPISPSIPELQPPTAATKRRSSSKPRVSEGASKGE